MSSLKKVGKVGGKAIIYFEIVTTLALIIGVIVVNIIKPGNGVVTGGSKGRRYYSNIQARRKALAGGSF